MENTMGISTLAKERNRPVLRAVGQWARQHHGYANTPSQQTFESNTRDAYFWRR